MATPWWLMRLTNVVRSSRGVQPSPAPASVRSRAVQDNRRREPGPGMINATLAVSGQSTAGPGRLPGLATATAELVGDTAAAPPGARNTSSTAVVIRPES